VIEERLAGHDRGGRELDRAWRAGHAAQLAAWRAMLDLPVSGGGRGDRGTLAIMVGGPEPVFDEVKEILSKLGASVTRVGEIGSGNVAKLANQIIVGLNIAALGEAMVLATKAGVDPARVFQAIRGGLAGSTVMEAKMPLILARSFKPGFRIELHIKDLANATETAEPGRAQSPVRGGARDDAESRADWARARGPRWPGAVLRAAG
jgi:2-hydroxy-3-oxopropionate reductase